MRERELSQLDALLDEANDAWFALPGACQREWSIKQRRAWIYHELQQEGHAVLLDDVERALSGVKGDTWYDENRLALIRRCAELLAAVREQGLQEAELTREMMASWWMGISSEDAEPVLRKKDNASEHYRHDVLPPKEIDAAFSALLHEVAARRNSDHPAMIASHLVFQMMRIWPWQHWSALLGRLGASLILIASGYPPLVIPVSERAAYYQTLYYDESRMDDLVIRCLQDQLRGLLEFAKDAADT